MKDLSELRSVRDCIAFAKSINPHKEPLTIEKLRTFPGCEHYTDEEAKQIIQTFDTLTKAMFELMTTGALTEEQSSKIIQMKPAPANKSLTRNTKAA